MYVCATVPTEPSSLGPTESEDISLLNPSINQAHLESPMSFDADIYATQNLSQALHLTILPS